MVQYRAVSKYTCMMLYYLRYDAMHQHIELVWCTTESMVADVMTKIVSGAQDKRLAARFYNDVDLSQCALLDKRIGQLKKASTIN